MVDGARQAALARFQSGVQYYKGLRYSAHWRDGGGSSRSSGEEGIPEGPERNCRRKR